MKVTLCLFASLAIVLSEPPVNYLPPAAPSGNYGNPEHELANLLDSPNYQSQTRPNTQYGTPPFNQQYAVPNEGYPNSAGKHGDDYESEPANYNFEYHVQDAHYGVDFGHQEQRQDDVAQGKYFVLLPDGRRQIVEYVADQNGYNPKVTYEETGHDGYNNGGYANHEGGYRNDGGHNNNGGYQY